MSLARISLIATLLSTLSIGSVWAVTYPSIGPSGSFSGWAFGTYFQNMVNQANKCPVGYYMYKISDGSDLPMSDQDTLPAPYGAPVCRPWSALTSWLLIGNTGTLSTANFLGTNDAQDLVFKTNGIERMRILNTNGDLLLGNLTLWHGTWGNISNIALGENALSLESWTIENLAIGKNVLQNALRTPPLNFSNRKWSYNVWVGNFALSENTSWELNTGIWYGALSALTTWLRNTAIWHYAWGNLISGYDNIAIGSDMLFPSDTGNSQLNIGNWIYGSGGDIGIGVLVPSAKLEVAGQVKITGGTPGLGKVLTSDASGLADWQTPLSALIVCPGTGANNTCYGTGTLFSNTTGQSNTAIGSNALYANITWSSNTAIGKNSLPLNSTGANNTALWAGSLRNNTIWVSNVANGAGALYLNTTGNYNVAIWVDSMSANTTGVSNTAVGNNALLSNTTWNYNVANGDSALSSNTTGNQNTANGVWSLRGNTIGSYNTANGMLALYTNTIWSYNTANWQYSLYANTTGDYNTANGHRSMRFNTLWWGNTANGSYSLQNNTLWNQNSAYGDSSLSVNTLWNLNAAYGASSLVGNTTGTGNIGVGYRAWNNITTGSKNIAIGYDTAVLSWSLDNQLNIGNWIYGNSGSIGIGISNPTAKLEVAGQVKITGGSPSLGKVLTSDATGLATWETPSGGGGSPGWLLTGNSGTNSGNFLGTTDAQNLIIKTNNIENLRITTTGNMGWIGYATSLTGTNQIALWYEAGNSMAWAYNTALGGENAWFSMAWYNNFALGGENAWSNMAGDHNVALGWASVGSQMAGSNNTALGWQSAWIDMIWAYNVALGWSTAWIDMIWAYNVALGWASAWSSMNWTYNVAIGTYAWSGMTGNTNIFIWSYAIWNSGQSNQFSLWNIIYWSGMGTGGLTMGRVGIGTMNPWAKLDIIGSIKITDGSQWSGKVLTSNATGLASWQTPTISGSPVCPWSWVYNTCYGIGALSANTTGDQNTAHGYSALTANTTGTYNSAVGVSALASNTIGSYNNAYGVNSLIFNTTGDANTAQGTNSMVSNTTGWYNTAVWSSALYSNVSGYYSSAYGINSLNSNTIGWNNAGFGAWSLYSNVSWSYNVANGTSSLWANITGDQNTAIGYNAGSNLTSGNSNVFIWANTQPNISNTASNQLNIGNWIYGNAGNIGVGTTNPLAKLDVNGVIAVGWVWVITQWGNDVYANVRVLRNTSPVNTDGMYIWYGGSGWPLRFFSNAGATEFMTLTTWWSLGIGTTNPWAKLEVAWWMRLNTATAKPICDSTKRGTFWFTQSATGVKDAVEVCAKDAADAYAWRVIY
jgi:trimeric autotransporter adhesin